MTALKTFARPLIVEQSLQGSAKHQPDKAVGNRRHEEQAGKHQGLQQLAARIRLEIGSRRAD